MAWLALNMAFLCDALTVYLRQSRGKTAVVLKRLCGRDCLVWSANIYRIAGFINYSREILAELFRNWWIIPVFGLRLPELMAFTLFWLLNVAIGFGGSKILNRFTAILSPLIYVVIIGLTIWAIRAGGGLTPILSYQVSGAIRSVNPLVAYLIILTRLWPFGQRPVRVWRILLRMRARHVLRLWGKQQV